MRLVTFAAGEVPRLGALLEDGSVLDLNRADREIPANALAFLEAGPGALDRARRAVETSRGGPDAPGPRHTRTSVRLLAPIPRPPKILCIRLNYPARRAEMGKAPPERPSIFSKLPSCVVGPGAAIVRPAVSAQLDFEGELAVVMGRRAQGVGEAKAYDYVAGYTLFNDVTAWDVLQRYQVEVGKNFDTFAPLGPYLATREEVPDPHALELEVRVNGQVAQRAGTGEMIFSIPRLIAFLSGICTLEPGDIIATGTPEGVGRSRQPPVFLQPGDRVEVRATGLGILENPIVDEERAEP